MAEEINTPAAAQESTAPAPAAQNPTAEGDNTPVINSTPEAKPEDEPIIKNEPDAEPKKPEGAPEKYEAFTMPDGFQMDEARTNETTALFKELNLPQASAQKLVDAYCKAMKEQQTAADNQLMETRKTWRNAIRSRADFREQNALMQKGFRMLVTTEAQKQLFTNSWLQDSPELFDLFVAAGRLAAEDNMSAPSQKANPSEAEINMSRFPNL